MRSRPLGSEAVDWISVDERLPEDDGMRVLVWDPELDDLFPITAIFDRGADEILWWNCGGGFPPVFENVTHWMPLPDPPEEVSQP